MTLRGRHEVERRRKRLGATLAAINGAALTPELTSHYARYACVLVSGYAEQAIKELVRQYTRNRSSAPIQRYVAAQLKRLRNINADDLRQLIESLDAAWWAALRDEMPDELMAFTSVAAVRNQIAHGEETGITIATVAQYFDDVSAVLKHLADVLDPV